MKLLYPAVGLCAATVVLAGCSGAVAGPTETALSMPPSPVPEQVDPTPGGSGSPDDSRTGVDVQGEQGADDTEDDTGKGGVADPIEHCVIVAGGVTTAMLAPLTLWPSSGPEDLRVLEQQILDLRDRVPTELHDDFTTLAHSAEVPPQGSGQFDEQAFQSAMSPIQDWLDAHCADK